LVTIKSEADVSQANKIAKNRDVANHIAKLKEIYESVMEVVKTLGGEQKLPEFYDETFYRRENVMTVTFDRDISVTFYGCRNVHIGERYNVQCVVLKFQHKEDREVYMLDVPLEETVEYVYLRLTDALVCASCAQLEIAP
jgi:hypothetical protein